MIINDFLLLCRVQHSAFCKLMSHGRVCVILWEKAAHIYSSAPQDFCAASYINFVFLFHVATFLRYCVCTCETKREREDTVYLTWSLQSVFKLWHFSSIFVYWAISAKCQLIICWVVFFLFVCLLVCTLIFKSMGRRL